MMFKTTGKTEGHVLIRDAVSGEIIVDKNNAIHFENFSEALALSLANRASGTLQTMVFGNGASTISGTGAITYFPPNVTGSDAQLYNQTYSKVINDQSPLNSDTSRNYIQVQHSQGNLYSDIIITCYLDYSEPSGQDLFDDSTDVDGQFVFDELGLVSYNSLGVGKLLTHVIFNPVQKALNRSIEVVYTLRIYMS